MKTATVKLESISPMAQGRYHNTEKKDKEIPKDYEERTWREKAHVNDDGYIFIPPMAHKNCLSEAAKYLSIQIPGKGKATYTKHFEAGIMVLEGLITQTKKDDVEGYWMFVPADGMRGGKKRVEKCFPLIRKWQGDVVYHILDETITDDVFEEHIKEAGNFIGLGCFRPRNNGYFGRFKVVSIKFS